ncbi:MAG: DNA-3-methyladenine glycosylase 2 family protein [Clostridia bacterium]|nr:DNA-3-methyladenine glycosylase 2 family protein [Clostridia bacterium]
MQIIRENCGIRIIGAECFDLSDTLSCGQTFRFSQTSDGFSVWSMDKYAEVTQIADEVAIKSDDADYFLKYFAFDVDYRALFNKLSAFPELRVSAEASKGVRLLRQDAFEMIISFIISANNNIPRIKKIINRLCEEAGKKTPYGYAFPTREQLLTLSIDDFVSLGAGYRAPYLYEAVRAVDDDFIAEVKTLPTDEAMKKLLTVKGVGPKVADCIMLFGLGRGDTFPVDVWMERALITDELNTNAKIRAFYLDRYGALAGLAQQYIYHYARNIQNKKA